MFSGQWPEVYDSCHTLSAKTCYKIWYLGPLPSTVLQHFNTFFKTFLPPPTNLFPTLLSYTAWSTCILCQYTHPFWLYKRSYHQADTSPPAPDQDCPPHFASNHAVLPSLPASRPKKPTCLLPDPSSRLAAPPPTLPTASSFLLSHPSSHPTSPPPAKKTKQASCPLAPVLMMIKNYSTLLLWYFLRKANILHRGF